MGNSVSSCDYNDLLDNLTTPQFFQTGDAEPELGLGPTFRSTHNGNDPNTPLITGLPYEKGDYSSQTHNLWEGLEIGAKIAGDDHPCLGMRTFRVPETPYEHSAEQKKKFGPKYVQTGYTERKNGTPERFEYKHITFGEVKSMAQDFMRGIVGGLGLSPEKSRIAIFLPNRPEFYIAAFGCWAVGIPLVPLYTTLGPDSIQTIIEDTNPEIILTTRENAPILEKTLGMLAKSENPHGVKNIIICDNLLDNRFGNIFDKVDPAAAKEFEDKYKVNMLGFSEVLELGQKHPEVERVSTITPNTLAFIMFTSGTTSDNNRVKGVQLTHGGMMSCTGSSRFIIDVPKHVSIFSFLPLSHVFQICLDTSVLFAGSRIDFGSGDIRQLANDLVEAQPYCLPAVPRIVSRFYQGVFDKINQEGFVKRWYIYRAYNAQCEAVRNNTRLDSAYDDRVFKLIRTKMGLGNCKLMLISAAPCAPTVLEFMRILLGPEGSCLLSYGLTESHAGLCTSLPGDLTLGHIGTPLTSCEYRLKNVEDMEMLYTDDTPRGELLVRGNSITPGYYNNAEEDSKAFIKDKDGLNWYQTGDIVKMHKTSGVLTVIDRRKNCLKLGQGEYVSIEKLISIYGETPLLSQIFPYGNSYKYTMVGVLVPNMMELYKYAVQKGWWSLKEAPIIGSLTPAVVAQLKSLGEEHQDELVAWLKAAITPLEAGMNSFEKIKAFHVDTHYQDDLGLVFCEANGLLTPTMKLKSKPLARHYHHVLEALYDKLGEPTPQGQPWW